MHQSLVIIKKIWKSRKEKNPKKIFVPNASHEKCIFREKVIQWKLRQSFHFLQKTGHDDHDQWSKCIPSKDYVPNVFLLVVKRDYQKWDEYGILYSFGFFLGLGYSGNVYWSRGSWGITDCQMQFLSCVQRIFRSNGGHFYFNPLRDK